MRDWYPDELAMAGAEHLDEGFVAGYEAKARYEPAEDVELLLTHGLDTTGTVADLGAGTGVFSGAMARQAAHVLAVDPSPVMTAAMERRLDHLSNVRVVQAGFLTWPAARCSVAAAFSRNALHHLPDFWKVAALRRIANALRPNGLLRLRDLVFAHDPGTVDDAIDAWLRSATDDSARGYTAPELVDHVRHEFSTFTWLLEPMLVRCGFEILDEESNVGVYSSYTCRKAS